MTENALKDLYSIIDIDTIGEVLGYGLSSVAIKTKESVLVYTKEKEKVDLMDELSLEYGFHFKKKENFKDWFIYEIEEFFPIQIEEDQLKNLTNYFFMGDFFSKENPPYLPKPQNEIEKAFDISIKIALNVLGNKEFQIDIHKGQFMKFKDKIICIDPILIYNS